MNSLQPTELRSTPPYFEKSGRYKLSVSRFGSMVHYLLTPANRVRRFTVKNENRTKKKTRKPEKLIFITHFQRMQQLDNLD